MKLAIAYLAVAAFMSGETLAGLWDATVEVNRVQVPFRFEISGEGSKVAGTFFNGDAKFVSSGGQFSDGKLLINWDYTASRLEAAVHDGVIDGKYYRAGRDSKTVYPFHAKRFVPSTLNSEDVPSIAGLMGDSNQERQRRIGMATHCAAIGARSYGGDAAHGWRHRSACKGLIKTAKFVLSHFSGARPAVFEVKLLPDGSLDILQNGNTKLTATRSAEAKAKGLPEPYRSFQTYQREGSDQAVYVRISGPEREAGHERRPSLPGKVVLINLSAELVPELPR